MILVSAALVLAAIVLLIAGVVLAKPFLVMWSIVVSVLSAVCLLIGALLRRHELFPAGGRSQTATPQPQPHQMPQMAHAGGPAYSGPPSQPSQQTPHQMPHQMPQQMPAHMTQQMANPMMAAPVATPAPATETQQVPFPGAAGQEPPERRSRPPMPRPLPGGGLGPDSIVLVIPGRKRFHLPNCRQLADREIEELTLEEAREEGFSPCTACVAEGLAPAKPDTPAKLETPAAFEAPARLEAPAAFEAPARREAPGRPETPVRAESPASAAWPASPAWAETPVKPVEPAETASGRAGSAVSADADEPADTPTVSAPSPRAETAAPTVAAPLPPVPSVPPASSEWSAFSRPTVTPAQAPTPSAPDPEPAKPEPVAAESATVKEEKPETIPDDATVHAPRPAKDEDGEEGRDEGDLVHVLVGTRRFHHAECSLVGDEESDIETMTKAEAEAAGLTQCSACSDK
ncbi:hypothetical protein Aph01nite_14890 [Acrocarpospora phusangensis]|uniref:Uncharacterized protein n=1 Tax=Acrocarpospora phusangensis TaxID=1070424 RepID=A0A919UIK4_9ACTN|nr:hypothetical protein [Acrocarpospora phusangensis]GIH23179.1 hypothetical protein Aph01nite_14890 [Acrocarpospora phusangensis]